MVTGLQAYPSGDQIGNWDSISINLLKFDILSDWTGLDSLIISNLDNTPSSRSTDHVLGSALSTCEDMLALGPVVALSYVHF